MLIAAAGVLASEGSLEKAASVLEWPGFPEGHEGHDYFPNDEEALKLWVEGEAERIEGVIGLEGFRLAATRTLMDEAELPDPSGGLEAGDLVLKPSTVQALGISPQDLTRAVLEDVAEALMAVPDPETGEPVPFREMNADDHRRVFEAVEIRRIEAERMGKVAGDIVARMKEAGCGPDVTVGEFLEGSGG